MRFATDFFTAKTTLAALAAILTALVDAASKGELTWQQGLVIVLAVFAATLRDTLAKGHEETKLSAELFTRTLETSAAAARATSGMAEHMAALMSAATPTDATPRRNVAGKVWPDEYPEAMATMAEPDGECDRPEETP